MKSQQEKPSQGEEHVINTVDSSNPSSLPKRPVSVRRRIYQGALKTSMVILILLASYVTLGRLLVPLLEGQKERLEQQLNSLLGVEVSIGRLTTEWQKFSPTVMLQNLAIPFTSNAEPSQIDFHIVDDLKVEFNIPASLSQRNLVIRGLSLKNVVIEIVESEDGLWGLSGFSGGSNYNEQIVNFLLNTTRLELTEAQLLIQRFDGSSIELKNIYVQLVNSTENHQLQVQFRLYDQSEPIQIQLELTGDPRRSVEGTGYTSLKQVDLTRLLATVLPNQDFSEVSGQAELWFELADNSLKEFHGKVSETIVLGAMPENTQGFDLSSGLVDITVRQEVKDRWQFWFENIEFDWHKQPWPTGDFFVEVDLREEGNELLEVSAEKLDLDIISAFLDEVTLPESGREILNDLRPSGQLSNVHFMTGLSDNYPGTFDLRANLENVAVSAWRAAPSVQGVNGYIQANLSSGFVELDSTDFDIHLPLVFDQGWHYDSINSRVQWDLSEELIRINSSVIDVHNETLNGRVQFELNNTRNSQGSWETDLTLFVGIQEFSASNKSQYLPKLANIENTMNWLDQALLSGEISNSGFLFRGVTGGNVLAGSSTMQTFYNVENAQLMFLPDWPVLEKLTAFVNVDNQDVDIQVQEAEISGIELNSSSATVRQSGSSSWLAINAHGQTTASLGLDFLRDTPVRDSLGGYIDNWNAAGDISAEINLGIPLNNETLENTIDISVLSENTALNIPDYDLEITEIKGLVNYNSISGLNASELSASMFEGDVVLDIENYNEQVPESMLIKSGMLIKSSGRVTSLALQRFTGLSTFTKNVLSFADGETQYDAELRIAQSDNQDDVLSNLTIQSDLLGLTLNLPEPFNKNYEEMKKLNLNIDYLAESEVLTGSYSDDFYTQMKLSDGVIDWGGLYFGKVNQTFESRQIDTAEQGVAINGTLEYFDYDAWEIVSEYFSDEESEIKLESLIRLVDVNISQLNVLGQELFDIHTMLRRSSYSSWGINLENEVVRGFLDIPDDLDMPYEVQFDYLHLPEGNETEDLQLLVDEIDIFSGVDPNTLPNLNFKVDDFSIGENDFGEWQFTLRGNSLGVSIRNLIITMDDARITGLSDEGGAEIEWLFRNGFHTSRFTGVIMADDLSEALPKWGYGASLESESATFVTDLQWQGSPVAFSMLKASGNLDVNILEGRFIDIDSGGARIFGALNFDSISRRLQLDFSDLYETGLAFDEINGKLLFTEGNVMTDGVVVINGPSSIINVDGEIDLVNRTVNTDLLVSIPISQNIAVVAGILGAWPVAVGTFVVGKIFRDEFAGLTAVRYRLDGAWDELNTGFEPAEDKVIFEGINE